MFSIKIIKSLPKFLVGPTGPMAPLTQMAKVVTSLYYLDGSLCSMGFSRPWDFDLRLLNIFHIEMVC